MDIQQVIALALGAVALFVVGRHVWAEVRSLINPDEAGACPGCGGCDAAEAEKARKPASSPLTSIGTSLPPHLEKLRRSPKAPQGMKHDTRGMTDALRDLRRIPGIGASLSEDLWDLGYRRVEDLKDEDPEAMYARLEELRGTHQDRCVLYTFRCAVYFASEEVHDPDLLRWWNWKDRP